MRKLLIILLVTLLLVGIGVMVSVGLTFGEFKILSINDLIGENEKLETEIASLQGSIDRDYASAEQSLNSSFQNLKDSKQRYQDAITYSTEDEIRAANQTEEYDMGYLWTKIGMYATKNNVVIEMNVTAGSVIGQYNLNFSVRGQYLSISEFIYAVENDSKLGFKIEDFALVQYSEDELQGTFNIRNVAISKNSLVAAGATVAQDNTSNDTNNVNNNGENKNSTEDTDNTENTNDQNSNGTSMAEQNNQVAGKLDDLREDRDEAQAGVQNTDGE